MNSLSIREARKHLGDLVSAAERGESVTITRRGRKVARLVPVAKKPVRGLPDLTEFRASLKVKGRGLSDEVIALRRAERY